MTRRRQIYTALVALKQSYAEFVLQRFDLAAYGPCRDIQLIRCLLKTCAPGRGLEDSEGCQGWEPMEFSSDGCLLYLNELRWLDVLISR